MSRDLTPSELYAHEQWGIKNGLGSLWDVMKNTTVTYDGKTFPYVSEETLAVRQSFPYLGRLYNRFDNLYELLSLIEGGMERLSSHEKALQTFIETGQGDPDSFVIKWFHGALDSGFYYSDRNDELFLSCVRNELGTVLRVDPFQGNCFWFPLSDDKCISVWYTPDPDGEDYLSMKLEARAEDGSMGPHCELIFDESYTTGDLSRASILETLREISADAGLDNISKQTMQALSDDVMTTFLLKQPSLDEQLNSAKTRAEQSSQHHKPNFKDLEQGL